MCEVVEEIADALAELEARTPKKFEVFEIEVSQESWFSIIKNRFELVFTGRYEPFKLLGKHLTINHDATYPFALKTRARREEA